MTYKHAAVTTAQRVTTYTRTHKKAFGGSSGISRVYPNWVGPGWDSCDNLWAEPNSASPCRDSLPAGPERKGHGRSVPVATNSTPLGSRPDGSSVRHSAAYPPLKLHHSFREFPLVCPIAMGQGVL
jgi:hypothetical protein